MNYPNLVCIDDSLLVQSLVARELDDYEVQLHFADDGIAGLACCQRYLPDLVMLDIKMPTMDGIAFLKKWRTEIGFNNTHFIIMTAERSREIVETVLQLGISDYLAKPFSGKTMVDRISRHIPLKKKERSQVIPHTPRLFASPAANPANNPVAIKPEATSSEEVSFKTIRVLTKSKFDDSHESAEEEHSLHEIIAKYQLLMPRRNASLTSIVVHLLNEGKVRVTSGNWEQKIELQGPKKKISSAAAASLLARYFEEQRADSEASASATQRIVLRPPTDRKRSTS